MNARPNSFLLTFLLINFLFAFHHKLLSQDRSINKACLPPSEQDLVSLLQEITSLTQDQGLQIGGMIAGAFTNKEQIDYVLWLKEQANNKAPAKRQIFKLACQESKWEIVCKGMLPAGLSLSKKNFVDVTGDAVLELLYNFSYVEQQCVDGCAIVSFQKDSLETLYHKKEYNNCQNIDWSHYKTPMDLPFVRYQLSLVSHPLEPHILEKRFFKKYHGGLNQEAVIQQAHIDSTATPLVYHRGSHQFIETLELDCDSLSFVNEQLDIRHPAVRLAEQHINKNTTQYFDIEGVYRAHFSNKNQIDYLFYTNPFQQNSTSSLKRKAIKISCDGIAWKVIGVLYVAANFSKENIQDVNGDGIDEILDEQIQSDGNAYTKNYRILSFRNRAGQLIYTHKNHYASSNSTALLPSSNNIEALDPQYTIRFEDLDNDGIKELIQSSSQGKFIFVYDTLQDRYILQP